MKLKLLFFALLFSVLSWGQIYQHDFGTTAITTKPYTGTPTVLDPNLNSSSWTTSAAGFAGFAGNGGGSSQSLSLSNSSGTPTMTLTFNVAAGYQMSVTQFDFWRVRSATGAQNWSMTINGTNVGTGTVPTAGAVIGSTNVSSPINNLTGTITVVLTMSGASGNGTFRLDDFTLTGTVTSITPQPEINITGNGSSILTGDVSPTTTDFTDFGNVNIASSLSRNFVVQNLGTANLSVTGATITGANASEFVITSSPVGTITSAGNAGLTIQFTPTASGIRTATVTVTNNDSNEGTYTFVIQGNANCVPVTIASVFPLSGPVGTEVTINASSGSLLGSTVNFNGTAATIVSSSALQLVVLVPAGATTGTINIVNTTTSCTTSTASFTIINQNLTSCDGATTSDLIIYDIHDEETGSGGFITLYNGTATSVNLANYKIYRTTIHDNGAEVDYANLTGTIAPGALGILKVSVGSCGPASTNGTINGGFNENDGIQLRNAAGTVVIDDVDTYATAPGYYMVRNTGALNARTSYVAADWSTTPLAAGVCYASAGLTLPSGGAPPSVSVQPTLALTCASTTASMSVSATEGFAGGNALAYQWYVVAPSTTAWTALTNVGVYSGATSGILNISSLTGLDGYQYYCQVRENTATCYIATVAVKISTSATTWNGSTWSNGIPTLSKAVTINGNYNTSTNGDIDACSLIVNVGFITTVTANRYINIQNNLTVNGTLNVQDDGSLVQISNTGVNNGDITYSRTTDVRLEDYVYWSTPVTGQTLSTKFSGTPTNYMWRWAPTATNANGGQGTWSSYSGVMTAGEGYIVRAATGTNASTPASVTTSFTGVPHNGIYSTVAIARGTDFSETGMQGIIRTATDDNWNLLGNPYPSALDVVSTGGFLDANPQLEGFVKIWTHAQSATNTVDPFYQNFISNYYVNDYNTYNRTGLSSGPGDYKVGSGQGFMVLMVPGTSTTSTVTFNNSMRSKTFANNQFWKSANANNANTVEKHRIWVDLVSPTETTRTLVGYVEGATQGLDNTFDAFTDYKPSQNFYSIIDNNPYIIQGKALPFDVNDRVPMGIKIPTNGSYTIALAAVDGLFSGNTQKIYIEDKLLNTINDITNSPYQFTANQGITNDRFVLRYTDQALSNADFNLVEDGVSIFGSNNEIKINSSLENIKHYAVYNVLGQILATKNNVNTNQSEVSSIMRNNQTLIVKVTLENRQTVIKKIIF